MSTDTVIFKNLSGSGPVSAWYQAGWVQMKVAVNGLLAAAQQRQLLPQIVDQPVPRWLFCHEWHAFQP